MSLPVLWHIPVSHYDEKVRWGLDLKGVEHERRAPPPPPAHMAVAQWLTRGGANTFPLLVLDGHAIADSTAIIVALERRHPDPPVFHPDSYGYRPGRSAHDALRVCRERCWRYDWAIDLDLRAFFDTLDHSLVLKAVAHHTDPRWILLYVERWLKAPLQLEDGTLRQRDRGSPQGSAISPVLANLFLHYALDLWLAREFPEVPFERYADVRSCTARASNKRKWCSTR